MSFKSNEFLNFINILYVFIILSGCEVGAKQQQQQKQDQQKEEEEELQQQQTTTGTTKASVLKHLSFPDTVSENSRLHHIYFEDVYFYCQCCSIQILKPWTIIQQTARDSAKSPS